MCNKSNTQSGIDFRKREENLSLFCFCAGILSLAYYVLIVVYAGITADFAWFWILVTAVLEGTAVLIRYGRNHPGFFPGWLGPVALGVVLAGIICFGFLCSCIISGMKTSAKKNLDYVVVLGAHVKGDVPSKALELRLKAALKYARENENTTLILSGGQGFGEDITEAKCMENYLTAHGISRERLVLEEKSTSTKENLKFSAGLTGCSKKNTGILSNNFHVYRAVKIAEKAGYEHPYGIAAASDPIMQVHYVVREVAALIKAKLCGNI